MNAALVAVVVPAVGMALWLGLYLLVRGGRQPQPCLTALGLVAYALALTSNLLLIAASDSPLLAPLARLAWLVILLPAVAWAGALAWLLPEHTLRRAVARRVWLYGLAPLAAVSLVVGTTTDLIVEVAPGGLRAGPAYPLLSGLLLLPLAIGLGLVVIDAGKVRPRPAFGLLLVATLFFMLGVGLLLLPLAWWPRLWMLLAIGVDLVLLGVAIAAVNAFEEGETLLPDMARSGLAAGFGALVFGVPVALTIATSTGLTAAMLALLLAVVATAVTLPILADPLQTLLDRLVLARWPQVQRERADLRAAASALPRLDPALDPAQLDEAEFARLTRRALSHYGDLSRLASSPLTRLPLVEARLAQRGVAPDTLVRASELKAVLAECIAALKPQGQGDFGVSDEWRYYNALYFPYVVGLKPYSLRLAPEELDAATRAALAWFRTSVPERTLHNWQTTAARLVAQQLRERQRQLV